MKCPKCDYLGFETGDRCRNCGYDFSLMADASIERIEIDLDLREADQTPVADFLAQVEEPSPPESPLPDAPVPPMQVEAASEPDRLPLFTPAVDDEDDDAPLVTLPPTPRPPLAVRRTPESQRLRAMTAILRRIDAEPTPPLPLEGEGSAPVQPPETVPPRVSRVWREPARERISGDLSSPGARAAAAAIDHVMLAGIDLAVVYFTLRMTGLPVGEWTALPPLPFVAFLLLIKLSYFCAFTAVGGQTIGKMAAHIRVVGADDRPLDAASALRRTLAGVLSAVPLGLGFVPALLGPDRRALHDRVARTRVIALKSA